MRLWQSRKCCSEYSEQTFGMMCNSRISISSRQPCKLVHPTFSLVRKVSNPACRTARSSVKVEFITEYVGFRCIHEMKKVVRGSINTMNEVDD